MIPKNKKAKEFAIIACTELRMLEKDGSFFPYIGELKKTDTIDSILLKVYESGRSQGFKEGRLNKVDEIKQVLNIEL